MEGAIAVAKQEILKGHNTGYYHKKLAIALAKSKQYHKAVHLCRLILNQDIIFSEHGCGHSEDWRKRLERAEKGIVKAEDKEGDVAFTETELERIEKVRGTERKADLDRVRLSQFATGFEIKTSRHPNKNCRFCSGLQGFYPLTFKWDGWGNKCSCTVSQILLSAEEVAADMLDDFRGVLSNGSVARRDFGVEYAPINFIRWGIRNWEDVKGEYYIRENLEIIEKSITYYEAQNLL